MTANVRVFSLNNRKNVPMRLTNQYKLLIEEKSGNIYTRIDSDPEFNHANINPRENKDIIDKIRIIANLKEDSVND